MVSGAPLMRMRPSGVPPFFSSVSMLSRVVLPAPDGPRIATTCPDVTEPLMSLSSCLGTVFFCILSIGVAGLPLAETCTV